jgi:hypothetical protein
MKNRATLTELLPPNSLEDWLDPTAGMPGLRRLRDLEFTGTFLLSESERLINAISKGTTIWVELPNSPLEVRCVVIKVNYDEQTKHVSQCTLRPTGAPRVRRRERFR